MSQPDGVSGLVSGLLLLSQVVTGALTGAFPDHAHDGLQQSQYRVVCPEDCAKAVEDMEAAVRRPNTEGLCMFKTCIENLSRWTWNCLFCVYAGVATYGIPSHHLSSLAQHIYTLRLMTGSHAKIVSSSPGSRRFTYRRPGRECDIARGGSNILWVKPSRGANRRQTVRCR